MLIKNAIEFGKEFINRIKLAIEEVEKLKKWSGVQKKAKVDAIAYEFFDANFDKLKINFLVKGYLKKRIRKAIPDITQKVFDLIETSIEGITNKIKK